MKVLVLGAAGMAGHTIALYFKEQGHDVTAFSRKPFPFCNWIQGDAFDTEYLRAVIVNGDYDAVINCIGLLNQFAESAPEKAVYINSYLPHRIVAWLEYKRTRFIQMSTDCVFAGNTGPYSESSFLTAGRIMTVPRHWERLMTRRTLPLEILLSVRISMRMASVFSIGS